MRILLSIPSFNLHGGTRIFIEIANRLAERHEVSLYSLQGDTNITYWDLSPQVRYFRKMERKESLKEFDCLLVMSPHTFFLTKRPDCPKRVFLHLQMMENLFLPDSVWIEQCREMYQSPFPMFSISQWNIQSLREEFCRTAETIYIGNGLNTSHFPIEKGIKKDGKVILVEGWNAYNQCKDVERYGPQVALMLRNEGYTILSYGQSPMTHMQKVPHEYHLSPELDEMNDLYRRSTVLIKATKVDARACAPIEAGSKGCVTVRSICRGDDDLVHMKNCLRVGYNKMDLYNAARRILRDESLFLNLQQGMFRHLEEECNWGKWIGVIEERIMR